MNVESNCWGFQNVNPLLNKEYRDDCLQREGKLKGVFSKQMKKDMIIADGYLEGRIKFGGDANFGVYSADPVKHDADENLDIHVNNSSKKYTYVKVHDISLEERDGFQKTIASFCGRAHGNNPVFVNLAMEIGLKLRKGIIWVLEESRDYAERIIRDGMVSPLQKSIYDVKEDVNDLKKGQEEMRNDQKTFQVTMMKWITDFVGKATKLPRKAVKKMYKGGKAVSVLNEIKKHKKSVFSRRDYKNALMRFAGQSDDRTINSDLETLVGINEVIVGVDGYKFKDNTIYDEFHGSEARRAFNEKMKAKLREFKEITLDMFKGLVKDLTGLIDDKSVSDRLEGLITLGWLTPLGSNGNIFTVQLN